MRGPLRGQRSLYKYIQISIATTEHWLLSYHVFTVCW